MSEEAVQKVEREPSIDSDASIEEVQEINPEGYGIEEAFVPVAVFDTGEDGNLFEDSIADSGATVDMANEIPEYDPTIEGEEDETLEGEELENLEEEVKEEGEGEETKDEEVEGEEEKSEEEEEKGEEEEGEQLEGEEQAEGEKKEIEEEKPKVKFDEVQEGEKKKIKKEVMRRRMSIRKKSIFYPTIGRFRETDEHRISGDFTTIITANKDLFSTSDSPPSITSFHVEGESSIEEEFEAIDEYEEPVDREYYYNLYNTLTPISNFRRMKNNFLHRKMAEYFKKRKMEHVLKETDQQVDSQQKYDKKLDALSELKELDTRERDSITSELNDLREQRNDQLSMLKTNFHTMQSREKEVGMGLINTKTGKEIPDKLVERLLKRQRDKWMEVAKMRLAYIKIRNKVAEKKSALHALDCIGENLHLIDFEQLKIENQSHTDKIEERDEELTRLRVKCSSAMQCLAHVREKSAAVLIDIQKLSERLEEVEMEFTECRERLNYFKQERDNYRAEKEKICEESGLLTKPKLLADMEIAIEDVKSKSKQLEDLKKENERLRTTVQAIKKNISLAPLRAPSLTKPADTTRTKTVRIYRGRPTLIYPELPQSDWSETDMILDK